MEFYTCSSYTFLWFHFLCISIRYFYLAVSLVSEILPHFCSQCQYSLCTACHSEVATLISPHRIPLNVLLEVNNIHENICTCTRILFSFFLKQYFSIRAHSLKLTIILNRSTFISKALKMQTNVIIHSNVFKFLNYRYMKLTEWKK